MAAWQGLKSSLPALLVIYAATFGGMLSGLSTQGLQIASLLLILSVAAVSWRQTRFLPALIPLLAVVSGEVIAVIAPPYPGEGAQQVTLWLALTAVFWLSSAVEPLRLERAVFASLAAMALIALYQAASWWTLNRLALDLPPRLGGTLWNPNNLAAVMLAAMALAVKSRRWLWVLMFLSVLVLTGSVASMGAALAGATALALFSLRPISLRRGALLAIALSALLLAPLVVVQIARRTHNALDQRLDLWRVAMLTFFEWPVSGIGPEGYAKAYTALGRLPHSAAYHHAHSVYLQVAAENGIVGLAALALILVIAVLRLKALFERGEAHNAAVGTAFLVAMALQGVLDYVYWVPSIVLIVLWTARCIDRVPAGRVSPPHSVREAAARYAPLVQTILFGFVIFRITAYLDHTLIALARHTTALSTGLTCLLYIAIPATEQDVREEVARRGSSRG